MGAKRPDDCVDLIDRTAFKKGGGEFLYKNTKMYNFIAGCWNLSLAHDEDFQGVRSRPPRQKVLAIYQVHSSSK